MSPFGGGGRGRGASRAASADHRQAMQRPLVACHGSTALRALSAFLLIWSLATVLLVGHLPTPAPLRAGWRFLGSSWGGGDETEEVSTVTFAKVRLRRVRRALKALDERDKKGGEGRGTDPAAAAVSRPLSVFYVSSALEERVTQLSAKAEGGFGAPLTPVESCFRYTSLNDGAGTVLVNLDYRCKFESLRGRGSLVVFNTAGYDRKWCGKTVPAYGLEAFARGDFGPCVDGWRDGAYFPPASITAGERSIDVEYWYGERRKVKCDVPCYYHGWVSNMGIVGDFRVRGTNWRMTYSMEGTHYYPDLKIGDKDYLSNHYFTTTSFKSEIPIPYFSFKEYNIKSPPVQYHQAIKGASFIAKNCDSHSGREDWVKTLLKYIRVDSLSDCMHNADPPNGLDMRDKKKIMRQYLFHLAFENGVEEDYITEKVWGALESGTVPVYLGAPNIKEHVPRGSVINALDFSTPKKLAEHLYSLSRDQTLYEQYHEWRNHDYDEAFLRKYNFTRVHSECRVCRWAYAKKFGYAWDHDTQSIVEPHLPRAICTDDHTGSAISPFLESWTGDGIFEAEDRSRLQRSNRCNTFQKHREVVYQNFTILRTIEAHDNVIDMTMKVSNKDRLEGEPCYLRLSLGSRLKNGDVYTTSPGFGKAIKQHAQWKGEASLCRTGGTYVSIQDDMVRVTVLSDWPTQMFSPQEGVIQILIHGGANRFIPNEESWKRLRIILEDRDKLHNSNDDHMPSTFCRFAAKDFFQPLEFFYSE